MILLHDYDAAARRAYYLRTRKLHPRARGSAVKKPTPKTYAQRRKELEARVVALKARLDKLQAAVKSLVEAAQNRSGASKNSAEKADATSKYEKQKSSDPTSKYEKKTAAQKADAAKAAEKYRDKNSSLEDQVKDLNNKIKTVREKIKRLQKTDSVGVSKHNV